MTSVCQNHRLVNPANSSVQLFRDFEIVWVLPPATTPGIAYEWKGVSLGSSVHLSADFGVICEFPHPPLAFSPLRRRPHWNQRQETWENSEELREDVDRGPQWKAMGPTDVISHIAGHGRHQLLRELCSLFALVSQC